MKTMYISPLRTMAAALAITLISVSAIAQSNNDQEKRRTDLVTVEETKTYTNVTFPGGKVEVHHRNDTVTRITLGSRKFEILDESKQGTTRIRMVHEPRQTFKGHWAGVDLGLNNFFSSPFKSELPEDARFMDLNTGKSVTVGVNILQHNIGLQKNSNNLGLVTGMGITFNNYRLDSPNILTRDEQGNTSYFVTDRDVKKNKLTTTFLTVPLLLEMQIPTGSDGNRIYISGGLYSGFKLGSHTKMVYHDNAGSKKEKSRSDLNVNSFKYGATVRAGYRFVKLYATCDLSRLFQAGQGPELYPWSVGITLLNF